MTQTFERAKSRLNNIRAIAPLLSALRTLSMGAWQMALNRLERMQHFEQHYDQILLEILPNIEDRTLRKPHRLKKIHHIADTVILLVGSERGLCGKFNQVLAGKALEWIKTQNFSSYQVWVMGTRLIRELERQHIQVAWRKPLPASELPAYRVTYETTQNWLEQYEDFVFNQFIILFNQPAQGGGYELSSFRLLPYEIHHPLTAKDQTTQHWPPAIIETNPKGIYQQVIEHHVAASFYQILLKSAAAEHASRFSMMQEAEDNAEEIIAELQQVLNQERKRKITQEMQELASGAGLLDN